MKAFLHQPGNYSQRLKPHHTDFERSCMLKKVFQTYQGADSFCRHMNIVYHLGLKPYKCRFCDGFHTSTVRKTRPKVDATQNASCGPGDANG